MSHYCALVRDHDDRWRLRNIDMDGKYKGCTASKIIANKSICRVAHEDIHRKIWNEQVK